MTIVLGDIQGWTISTGVRTLTIPKKKGVSSIARLTAISRMHAPTHPDRLSPIYVSLHTFSFHMIEREARLNSYFAIHAFDLISSIGRALGTSEAARLPTPTD